MLLWWVGGLTGHVRDFDKKSCQQDKLSVFSISLARCPATALLADLRLGERKGHRKP